jgi:hypothetical protein
MRLYLKNGPHIVEAFSGVGTKNYRTFHKAFGEECHEVGVIPYIEISNSCPLNLSLPAEVVSVVEKFSWRETIPSDRNNRPSGEYQWKSAKAVISRYSYNGPEKNQIQIEGPKLEDISKLYTMICGGLIHPIVSYDATMSPSPARNIRQLLREIDAIVRRDVTIWLTVKFGRGSK